MSRFICPLAGSREGCMALNDKEAFWGFMMLFFPGEDMNARRKFIENLQQEAKNDAVN